MEYLTEYQRKEQAKARRARAKVACDLLLARLYLHHKDHGGIEYRVVDLDPEETPTPPANATPENRAVERRTPENRAVERRDVDLPDVDEKNYDPEIDIPRPTISLILREVARFYGVGTDDIISSRRSARIIQPRQMAMYLSRMMTLCSLPEIGRRFGNRDHTTVRHGVLKYEALIAEGGDTAVQAEEIMAEIKKRTLHVAAIEAQRGIAECHLAQTQTA